jgi:hypothetical protein
LRRPSTAHRHCGAGCTRHLDTPAPITEGTQDVDALSDPHGRYGSFRQSEKPYQQDIETLLQLYKSTILDISPGAPPQPWTDLPKHLEPWKSLEARSMRLCRNACPYTALSTRSCDPGQRVQFRFQTTQCGNKCSKVLITASGDLPGGVIVLGLPGSCLHRRTDVCIHMETCIKSEDALR